MEPSLKTLDRYELRRVLARTATGLVYEGWDSRIARKVAIKTVTLPHAADPELADKLGRFKREAQAAGRLQHPNIVGIYDYGEADDLAFIVMEFVDGVPLKALFDRHERFETPTILRVMGGVLAGLQYSHERGIIHRDIKPSNIMLTGDGRAKIADFGIARIESSSLTQAGTVLGTPAYMSPEQFLGETVDARTDIYSAGVVLYQMLTGERPYDGGVATIMHKVLHTEAVKPSQISTQCSPALDAVVTQAMAKRREDRFPTAASLAEALRGAMDGGATDGGAMDATVIARPPIAPRAERPRPSAPRPAAPRPAARPVPPARRRPTRTLAAAVLAGLLVLGGVGGGAAWLTRDEAPTPSPPPQPAPALPVVEPPALPPAREAAVPAPPVQPDPEPAPPVEHAGPAPPEAVGLQAPTTAPAVSPPEPEPPASAELPKPPVREPPPPMPARPSESRSAFWMPAPPSPDAASPPHAAARPAAHPHQPRPDTTLAKQFPSRLDAAPAERPTPWIGLHVRPVSREDAAALGLGGPAGVLVTGVDAGGPAARASLRPNDVLTAFNGTQLSDSDSLDRAVQQSAIGEAASVESWRDGHFRRVSVDPVQAPGHAERADPSE